MNEDFIFINSYLQRVQKDTRSEQYKIPKKRPILETHVSLRSSKGEGVEKQWFCDKNQTSKEVLALIRRLRNAFASVPAKAQAATRVKTANKWKFHHDIGWCCCVDVEDR